MNDHMLDITVLLDRSGSMHTIKDDMEGGFKEFIRRQREEGHGKDTFVTLYQFDDSYETVYESLSIDKCEGLKIIPRGNTALVDSMVKCIDDTGRRLAAIPEYLRPGKILIVVITDGQENASRRYSTEVLRAKIEHQTQKYNWQFVYLGANQDSFANAGAYSIRSFGIANFAASTSGVQQAYGAMYNAVVSTRTTGTADVNPPAIQTNTPVQTP